MAILGVLFDKDGTLLDYHRTWMPVNRAAAIMAARGDEARAEDLLVLGGYDPASGRVTPNSPMAADTTAAVAALWAEALSDWEPDALTDAMETIFVEGGAAHAAPVTDLAAYFTRLRARPLRIGVATSDSHQGALRSLAAGGAADLLDFVAGYDSGYGTKPGPGMVQAFCQALELAPDQVAVVGDNRHDLEMGRSAGAALCIGVLSGTGTREELSPLADHVLADIVELEALL